MGQGERLSQRYGGVRVSSVPIGELAPAVLGGRIACRGASRSSPAAGRGSRAGPGLHPPGVPLAPGAGRVSAQAGIRSFADVAGIVPGGPATGGRFTPI